jgi:hypothetical protein
MHNSVQDTKQVSLYLIVAGDTVQYPEQLSDISTELQLYISSAELQINHDTRNSCQIIFSN